MAQIKTVGTDKSPSLTEQKRKETRKRERMILEWHSHFLTLTLLFGEKKRLRTYKEDIIIARSSLLQ